MLKVMRCTARELASVLVLSERRISELTRIGTLRKPYELATSVKAYLRFLRSNRGTLTHERSRLVKAQADVAELNFRERRGELVERQAVADAEFRMGRQVRDQVLNIPSRVSGVCAAESDQSKIHVLLTRELNQALEALAHG
jgi:phage terminase Nu1 subunit (DNA packaging protein)